MSKNFIVPDQKSQFRAIGFLSSDPPILQKAFSNFNLHFESIKPPNPDDWLGCHTEKGQSFEKFRTTCKLPTKSKKIFYIQPLNSQLDSTLLNKLLEFASIFFAGMQFILRPSLQLSTLKVKNRNNDGTRQYNAGNILTKLTKKMPPDAYAMIGITLEDIYHNEVNNFVFGLGSGNTKTGVFSFARYDERFYGEPENQPKLEYRAVKVMIHEMCHMFGLAHCIYFRCLMNGSNHIDETDSKPFYLCPVCTKKIQYSLKFDIVAWYSELFSLVSRHGECFAPFEVWYSARIAYLLS